MTDAFEPPPPGLVVGPDDILVVMLPAGTTPKQLDEMVDQVRGRNPQLSDRILFVAGVQQAAVIKR